jgi:hypothetical protein
MGESHADQIKRIKVREWSAVCNQGRELRNLQLANRAAASPALQPLEKFGMSAADKVHVFVWNVDWESAVKDWPYQFANDDYKVVMSPVKTDY